MPWEKNTESWCLDFHKEEKKHEQVLTENNTGESKFQENWSREGKIEPDMKKEEPL